MAQLSDGTEEVHDTTSPPTVPVTDGGGAFVANATAHFQWLVHAAVFRLIHYLRMLADSTGEEADACLEAYPFLADYFDELRPALPDDLGWDETLLWWQQTIHRAEEEVPSRRYLPLRRLARDAGLSFDDRLALILIGLVEDDIRFGALFATLQAPLPSRRMSQGLLAAILGSHAPASVERLLECGLIRAENRDLPRADWLLRVPLPLWDILHGTNLGDQENGRSRLIMGTVRFHSLRNFPPLKSLLFEPALRSRLLRLPSLIYHGNKISGNKISGNKNSGNKNSGNKNSGEIGPKGDSIARLSGLIVRGMEGSGRTTLLGSLARTLRRDLFVWHDRRDRSISDGQAHEAPDEGLALLGPLSLLTGAVPVLDLSPSPGETLQFDHLAGYGGIIGITLPREGGVSGNLVEQALTITIPSPSWEERLLFWKNRLSSHSDFKDIGTGNTNQNNIVNSNTTNINTISNNNGADIETLASRFRLPLGTLAHIARVAPTYSRLEGRTEILLADVQNASRTLNRQTLDMLAERMEVDTEVDVATDRKVDTKTDTRAGIEAGEKVEETESNSSRTDLWGRLVLNPTTEAELHDLELRCRFRERLNPHLGTAFPRRVNPGVRALFNGPSGTGKTLAAKVLAGALQMDLYRVDLAQIVNKYIGETEKNLARLLARAEELDLILLIDEGDSLLAGRTEVRNANDRYANQETNYLLQRLESYEGIIFVTTNASSRVDQAFERRFDAVIQFTLPDITERRRLWAQHLPADPQFSPNFISQIATTCELTGGQIRNAVMHAALLAASQSQPTTEADIRTAIRREYRKVGVACPLPHNVSTSHIDPIRAFLLETSGRKMEAP